MTVTGHVYSHRCPRIRHRRLFVGLQSKSVLILALIVVATTVIGGWLYFHTTSQFLRARDRDDAQKLSHALGTSVMVCLRGDDPERLQALAEDFVSRPGVDHVVLLDADGQPCAKASRHSDPTRWDGLARLPLSVYSVQQVGSNVLTIARPVVDEADGSDGSHEKLLGGVRLVLDTSATSLALAGLQGRIMLLGVWVVVCTVPLAYLLVRRVLVSPVRKLAGVTQRLAHGDFTARCRSGGNDEIGHLGYVFDLMADDIATMRKELIVANEKLEHTIAKRTDALQEANSRLREEMLEKEDFLRAVSHDLNAPLRNIDGMVSMILMKWRDSLPDDVITRLDRIQANVKMETELISDLLDLSRAWAESRDCQAVDIGQMIDELAETFDYELRQRQVEVVVSGEMPTLYVERNRIRQVFQNLIDNAIKYMDKPSGGRIEISACQEEGWHKFTVKDNGPGIPGNQLQKVFYVFRRAESPATASVKGRGVGLALVKAMVAKYKGRAYVTSQLGQGAAFHVDLPVEATSMAPEQPVVR